MSFHDRRLGKWLFTSASLAAMAVSGPALANPEGANVVAGNVAINAPDATTLIVTNNSARAIVDWNSFSIGLGELTRIDQLSASSAILNRVTGPDPSAIYGRLESNGQVYLINPNGIVVGPSGRVEVGSFVASTLDVTNTQFLAGGDMTFKGPSGAGITIHGKIRSVSGGDIFLLSREVTVSQGATLSSDGGYVGIGAGEEILLKPADDGNGRIRILAGKGKAVNKGDIAAAVAEIKAAGGNEYALAINNTGVVRATGAVRRGGRVLLTAGGRVRVGGRVRARTVKVKSKTGVRVAGKVDAASAAGRGGEVIFEAPDVVVEGTSFIDVSGLLGGGRIAVGGGFQGRDPAIENARTTAVEAGAVLKADALASGDGGEIVIWADGATTYRGSITARALGSTGDGGRLEVSGKTSLLFAGEASAASVNGRAGSLLLDPETINVVTALTGGTDNEILDSAIAVLLNAGTSVTISTTTPSTIPGGLITPGTAPAAAGDVNFTAGVRIIWTDAGASTGTTFTVNATRDINAPDNVIIQHSETGTGVAGNLVDGGGGVVFLAGRDINIGSAAARANVVAIGSEFGQTTIVAGDTDFDSTPDATGDVNVIGGSSPTVSDSGGAQIGYIVFPARAANTGSDFSDTAGNHAANGNITVEAGRNVNVFGGTSTLDYAQIGHGGAALVSTVGVAGDAAAIVDSDINVRSGVVVSGNVVVTGGNNFTAPARIGHGAIKHVISDVTVGDISGDITVTAVNSDILLNSTFTPLAAPGQQEVRAQIGHGAGVSLVNATGGNVVHGDISGNIAVDASGAVVVGASVAAAAGDRRYIIASQIGHGGAVKLTHSGGASGGTFSASYGRIAEFTDLAADDDDDETTNISVRAANITVRAIEATQNSSANAFGRKVDNLQRSQIGHGGFTFADHSNIPAGTTAPTDITVSESDVSGDIVVFDDTTDGIGITVESRITGTATATTFDAMIARVGHATGNFIEARDGGTPVGANGVDGGDITITQANILGARIDVRTGGVESDNEDIVVRTNVTAGVGAVSDNTTVAQIGHSGDIFAKSGDGGDGAAAVGTTSFTSGNAGDIVINKGTVWDGLEHFTLNSGGTGTYGDNGGRLDDDANSGDDGNTDIIVLSSNQTFVDSTTAAAVGAANRNNAESTIGHGHKLRLMTGVGGDNSTNATAASGGRGGDIQINQQLPGRDFADGTDSGDDDTARGLRGEVVIEAVNTADANGGLTVSATNSSALSPTNNNTDVSGVGHGDIIEAMTGQGGNGGASANVATAQVESFGGRGGHVDINLSTMLIESDIQLTPVDVALSGATVLRGGITGGVVVTSASNNALAPANRDLVEAAIGHSEKIFAHSGDGGVGGSAEFLANASPVLDNAVAREAFLQDLLTTTAGGGASRGGNGGDIDVDFGHVTDRQGNAGGSLTHDEEADVHVVVSAPNTSPNSISIQSSIAAGVAEGTGDDLFAGIGHHTRIYGEGGVGGNGGATSTQFDGAPNDATESGDVFIQPDASGGRGGDVWLTAGNITGDVVVDGPRKAEVVSVAGHGTFTKVISTIGHTTDVVAVTQNGGDGGNLTETSAGTDPDGGIEPQNSGATVTLVDGNDDDKFDLNGVTDANSTANEDGVDTNGDGSAETFTSLAAQFGNNPAGNAPGATSDVIFHDEEGDPQFLLDGAGNLVVNNAANNTAFAAAANNIARFGHTVGVYEADLGTGNDLPRFVDLNQDGAVDLVDFDADGRIDIVDVDRDGVYDRIDGRADFVATADNFGILDYRAVTGQAYDQRHLEGGWTLQNRIGQTVQNTPWTENTIAEDGTALVGDFSMSNGGRGGDAVSEVGYTVGDIAVDVGDPTVGADSLLVRSFVNDGVPTGGPRDVSIARIGHGAFQFSDTGASYANRAAGRTETDMVTFAQGHNAANGGDAGDFAINASGGRGGDATATLGAARDIDPGAGTVNETDHLAGGIYVNVDDDLLVADLQLGRNNQNDAKRITITATASNDGATNISVAQIGHGSEVAAAAGEWTGAHGALIGTGEGNTGGDGASNGGVAVTSSQTEIADGGRGGDATVTVNQIKGTVTVWTGADDGDGSNDFSIQILATKDAPIVPGGANNIVVAQIGHGRDTMATGGNGGRGDDGQYRGNGGRGGDATVTQTAIFDTGITIDVVHVGETNVADYFGNGLLIEAATKESSEHIVRAQAGHGDLAFAEGGIGGNGSDNNLSDVIEQRNQTVNGGRGGDVLINQDGYNYDIIVDLGPNLGAGEESLRVLSHVDTVNVGTRNHTFASIGHGGYGQGITRQGGRGGNRNGTNGISASDDPNLRDGVDPTNRIFLGTDRNGGRGGNVVVNIAVNGTGRIITGRSGLVGGVNDPTNGADITVVTNDDLSANAAATDGVLVEARSGKGDTQDRAIDTTTAIIGHSGYNRANATGATGGDGIQSTLTARISEGDGGDGGSATATTGFVEGDVAVTNINLLLGLGLSQAFGVNATDVVVRSIDQSVNDGSQHRADARIGHMVSGEALAGNGGASAVPGGPPPAYLATISARGGDGGDATLTQGALSGIANVIAEGSIQVLALADDNASPTLAAAVGHRLEGEAVAGNGGLGGQSVLQSQSLYFIYEALREFDNNVKAGQSLETAFNNLSMFEQKLVAPFYTSAAYRAKSGVRDKHGYFDDKYIGHFLDKLVEGARDDNNVGGTNFTIAPLLPGTSGEERTLLAITAAAGDGGHVNITQSTASGTNANTNLDSIILTPEARDTDNANRGLVVRAQDAGLGGGFQIAHVGHQWEVIRARGGDAAGVRAYSNGIGGDGGDVVITQYEHTGAILVTSPHKIIVDADDTTLGGARQRAWVGHRQTIAPDRPSYRAAFVAEAGDGGSELSNLADGRNGNGGDVSITQFGALTGFVPGLGGGANNLDITLTTNTDADDSVSIIVSSNATGLASQEAETHVGHDVLIASVSAGDAGRRHALHSPASLDEGVVEGNGGDIRIEQTDLGADIDITGFDAVRVLATTSTSGGNDAHTIIGHERTIGETADVHGDRTGTIVAGTGGDTTPEDVNDTAEINPLTPATGTAEVEDADGGTIHITHGALTDAINESVVDDALITIVSLTEDVDVNSTTALGTGRIEIGNQQHVHAQAGAAGMQNGVTPRTAGDGGDVRITRDEIGGRNTSGERNGDILITAIDRTNAGNREVNVTSTSALGTSQVLIGHEADFDITSGRGGFGADVFAALDAALDLIANTLNAATAPPGAVGEATLRDANKALADIANANRAIQLARQHRDRYTPANQTILDTASTNAFAALNAANAAIAAFVAGTQNETDTVNAIRAAAATMRTVLTSVHDMVVAQNGVAGSITQVADPADGGDILYTDSNSLSGSDPDNEGEVSGNIDLISGRDTTASGSADVFDTGTLIVTATANLGTAHTEAGHRRTMTNQSGVGGGLTDGPPTGGVAGDGGDISLDGTSSNTTRGDVTLTSDEVVVRSAGSAGTSETHLLHDVSIVNAAGRSDIEFLLGRGGDIGVNQNVFGGVTVNANHLSSSVGAEDSRLGAAGAATSLTQLGHQVDLDNDSDSDPGVGGNGTDDPNRGGDITHTQRLFANAAGDLVTLNVEATVDGAPSDVTIDAVGGGASTTRLGSTASADSFSGNPTDDGGVVVATQTVTGDLETTGIEDLKLDAAGGGSHDIFLGHDAVNNAQSGDVNGGTGSEFGLAVTATQTVSGNVTLDPSRSFEAIEAGPGEIHVGHEATQLAKSSNDTAAPPDGTNTDPDVTATQTVQAEITIDTGGILLQNDGASRVQVGHEAFITIDTDNDGTATSVSRINPVDGVSDNDDIVLISRGTAGMQADAAVTPSAGSLAGDIFANNTAAGEVEVGHRSTSTVSSGPPIGNGAFDTEHSIGGSDGVDAGNFVDLNADGTVANTAGSTITIDAFRDLRVINAGAGGVSQLGHYITETAPLSATAAATTPGSTIRQTVGSDIVIGDGTPNSTTGVGNNLTLVSGAGRAEIGHRSPGGNDFQVTGGAVITPQVLDGDITVEVGVNAAVVAPDGTTSAVAGTPGDDILIDGTSGVARIGHNHTDVAEASGNTVQVSAGDIWTRARGDYHIIAGNVGHEHYDHADKAIDTNNAVAGLGAVRNRIRGLTTLGAGQNSPDEDTVLTANVFRFDGGPGPVSVNSGYGGVGDADVDGELRFFTPAQQNITVVAPVRFNDSISGADPVTPRAADASNVFAGTGGLDHEHPFTTMEDIPTGTTRDYTDPLIGPGNYTFYFETPATGSTKDGDLLTAPYIFAHLPELNQGYEVIYRNEQGQLITVYGNPNRVAVGTSSFDLYCEETGQSVEECRDRLRFFYAPYEPGFGSLIDFAATPAGGNGFDAHRTGNPFFTRQFIIDPNGNGEGRGGIVLNTSRQANGTTREPADSAVVVASPPNTPQFTIPQENGSGSDDDVVVSAAGPVDADYTENHTGGRRVLRRISQRFRGYLAAASSLSLFGRGTN